MTTIKSQTHVTHEDEIMTCLHCDRPLDEQRKQSGRRALFCSNRCRVAHHRKQKRYNLSTQSCNETPRLDGMLILELFPGAGLFGKAFEALGACVVRAPDILWGGDVREFRGVRGKFDGVIGGPPCQFASRAARSGTKAINLIPEFLRVVCECSPRWAVMENVREARPHAPGDWDYVPLRDWDCGGLTHRGRGFWFFGIPAPLMPPRRAGNPEYSVLASNWNKRGEKSLHGYNYLDYSAAARLQGFPDLGQKIVDHQPGWQKANGNYDGISMYGRNVLAVHMLGNGVPFAMGSYVANHVARVMTCDTST